MCTHRLCELIGGSCSLAVSRSRGCRPSGWGKSIAPGVFAEVRTLLATIAECEHSSSTGTGATAELRDAAVRLAKLVRAEALEERDLVAHARADEPELAALLAPLVARATSGTSR